MGWQPTIVSTSDYQVIRKATFSGEQQVHIAPLLQGYKLATVTATATATGSQVNDAYNVLATLAPTGSNLVVGTISAFSTISSGIAIANFTGTDESDQALTGHAQFMAPQWASTQARLCSFPGGIGFDVTPNTAGKKWKTIAFSSFQGNVLTNSQFGIYMLPDADSFFQAGCIDSIDYSLPFSPIKEIPCGMDSAGGGVKPGRSEPPTFSIKSKNTSLLDGLARGGGQKCCLMIKTVKEGRLTGDVTVLANAYFSVKPNAGEGDDPATVSIEGKYEFALTFFPL